LEAKNLKVLASQFIKKTAERINNSLKDEQGKGNPYVWIQRKVLLPVGIKKVVAREMDKPCLYQQK